MTKYRIVPIARWRIKNQSSTVQWEAQKKVLWFWLNIGGKWLTEEEAEIYLTHHIKEL